VSSGTGRAAQDWQLPRAGLKGRGAEPVIILGRVDQPPFADEGQRDIRVRRVNLTSEPVPGEYGLGDEPRRMGVPDEMELADAGLVTPTLVLK